MAKKIIFQWKWGSGILEATVLEEVDTYYYVQFDNGTRTMCLKDKIKVIETKGE